MKPEEKIHVSIMDFLRMKRIFAFSVPNELLGAVRSKAGVARMARFKRMGLTPGVADIIVLLPGGKTVFFEVKAPGEKQSKNQVVFQDRVRALGYNYHVVRSVDEVCIIMHDVCINMQKGEI
jgi:hypothetical protein